MHACGVYVEHLMYCSRRVLPILVMCMSTFVSMVSYLILCYQLCLYPVIKDKCVKINDSDNYRPIALASVMSKILEKVILGRMSSFLITSSNLFVFKSKLGTDMCIYVLKEIVDNYKCLNRSMFMGFLDASKAFDRIRHSTSFKKLIDRQVPSYIVRIMIYWYINQTMFVRWSRILSEGFQVSNGVRQVSILSPYLLNVYINDLSAALTKCRTCCCIDDMNINHLMYADDLVKSSPSSVGLRELLSVCESYGLNHKIKFDHKKSAILISREKHMKMHVTSHLS